MSSVNKVFLMGRVGKDPTSKELSKGKVCAFWLATDRKYKKDNQPVTETEWHSIVAWNQPAEFASAYVKKGDTVYVEGFLHNRKWTDQQGNERYVTEVVISTIQKITIAKPEGGAGHTTYADRQAKPSYSNNQDAPF